MPANKTVAQETDAGVLNGAEMTRIVRSSDGGVTWSSLKTPYLRCGAEDSGAFRCSLGLDSTGMVDVAAAVQAAIDSLSSSGVVDCSGGLAD